VPYPGWVPVAADRPARRARYVAYAVQRKDTPSPLIQDGKRISAVELVEKLVAERDRARAVEAAKAKAAEVKTSTATPAAPPAAQAASPP
jgi:hypothetical protein